MLSFERLRPIASRLESAANMKRQVGLHDLPIPKSEASILLLQSTRSSVDSLIGTSMVRC